MLVCQAVMTNCAGSIRRGGTEGASALYPRLTLLCRNHILLLGTLQDPDRPIAAFGVIAAAPARISLKPEWPVPIYGWWILADGKYVKGVADKLGGSRGQAIWVCICRHSSNYHPVVDHSQHLQT